MGASLFVRYTAFLARERGEREQGSDVGAVVLNGGEDQAAVNF